MSSRSIVAKRYAKALFEIAQSQGQLAPVEEDLRSIVAVVNENEELEKYLQHPNIASKAKVELLDKIFRGKVSDLALNTIQLMVERKRHDLFPTLLEYFVKIANEALGQDNAVVYTPQPVTEEQAEVIADNFSKISGKKIRIENVVQPELLGGLQVRIGDRLYDGSLFGKLNEMQKMLKQSQAL